MDKVLIAVDDTKGSKNVLDVLKNLVRPPKEVLLLHVERLQGNSLMIDMIGDAEMSTLKEALKGTEHKEKLDRRAENILNYYTKELEDIGLISVRTIIREGIPAEEILKLAEEEGVDLVVVGSNGKKGLTRLIMGCVSTEVERHSTVPVFVGKAETKEAVHEVEEAVSPQVVPVRR